MPGAGSMKAANYIYEVAPKDGTALGVIVESAALEQVLGNTAAQYDAAKFTYVGRVATSNNIFMQWHTSKVQSIARLAEASRSIARRHRPGLDRRDVPRLLNAIIGTKFRLSAAIPPRPRRCWRWSAARSKAPARPGRRCSSPSRTWLREKKIRIILQTQPERIPTCPTRRASPNTATRPRTGRCTALYASGSGVGRSRDRRRPGIPADRLAILRDAFNAMVKDPDFVADISALTSSSIRCPASRARARGPHAQCPGPVRERAKVAFGR